MCIKTISNFEGLYDIFICIRDETVAHMTDVYE